MKPNSENGFLILFLNKKIRLSQWYLNFPNRTTYIYHNICIKMITRRKRVCNRHQKFIYKPHSISASIWNLLLEIINKAKMVFCCYFLKWNFFSNCNFNIPFILNQIKPKLTLLPIIITLNYCSIKINVSRNFCKTVRTIYLLPLKFVACQYI